MLRSIAICLLFLTATIPALAEEIVLKDGTKIVGRMTGITSDKIEVETSYGKVQLNRGEDRSTSGFLRNENHQCEGYDKDVDQRFDRPP